MRIDQAERPTGPLSESQTLPLVERLPAGLTPYAVAERLAGRRQMLFLDSAGDHAALARYSYIGAEPAHWITDPGKQLFASVRTALETFALERLPDLPPFQGGVAGMFGYGLSERLEQLPAAKVREFKLPALAVGVYDWIIAFDHRSGDGWIISTGYPETHARKRRERAAERIEQVRAWLTDPAPPKPLARSATAKLKLYSSLPYAKALGSSAPRLGFEAKIERAIEYIRAGDCFQVNLAQRLIAPQYDQPWPLYAKLRAANPAPFAGYLHLGAEAIVSASPERFLQVHDRQVSTRPIKGTRPVGATPEADAALREQLQNSEKDRAENVMIVDLLRNDLGRVCEYGSVRVPTLCQLESHPTVHHLVSEVVGRLKPNCTAVDLLMAAFPGGSVTGAPKVRAMQIIAELEQYARGAYCGSLGYLGFNGSMDTSILIRTFTLGQGWCQFPVGGGIVADSVPAEEYDETLHKASALLRVLPGGAAP